MNAQLFWNQTSNLCVTPTLLLILWVVLWVTHHIRLPLPSLNSDFLLVAWHRVRSVDIVEETFTLLRLWRRLRFDARVLACPVPLVTVVKLHRTKSARLASLAAIPLIATIAS